MAFKQINADNLMRDLLDHVRSVIQETGLATYDKAKTLFAEDKDEIYEIRDPSGEASVSSMMDRIPIPGGVPFHAVAISRLTQEKDCDIWEVGLCDTIAGEMSVWAVACPPGDVPAFDRGVLVAAEPPTAHQYPDDSVTHRRC